jgi:hypothetical protein
MIQFLSYGYCCSIYYGLLTLLLLLDALQLIQFYLLQPLLLYVWPYQLCYFPEYLTNDPIPSLTTTATLLTALLTLLLPRTACITLQHVKIQ